MNKDHGVQQGSILVNDITKITNTENNNKKSKFLLFADDKIPITTNPNSTDFIKGIH